MASDTTLNVGDVIKINNWHGIVMETHHDDNGNLSIIRVQTARNIFRGYGPEYIDIRMNPDAIQKASLIDLQQEINRHRQLLEGAVERMMTLPKNIESVSIAAD
ncbi:MAG: hypothetical protein DWQ04_09495 [Chloroflexi bacterium]|nr:MAG: hypothetical protein DWQ04_09495 [Chloroflexota bacterium]